MSLEVLHGGANILWQLGVLVALASLPFIHHLHNILLHEPLTQLCTTDTDKAKTSRKPLTQLCMARRHSMKQSKLILSRSAAESITT